MEEKDKFYRKFSTHEERMVGAELFQKYFVGFQKECDKRKSLLEPIAEEDIRETSVCVVSFNENNGIHYIRMATANEDLEPLIVFSKFGAKKGQTMINVPSDKGDACFEVKKECDHIVGYRNESDEVPDGDDYKYYDHDIIVYLSELDTKADIENFLERKFKCCPLCETSLDWEAIEKKLNLKKDEEL